MTVNCQQDSQEYFFSRFHLVERHFCYYRVNKSSLSVLHAGLQLHPPDCYI